MAEGVKIWKADGTLWLDSSKNTTRTLGVLDLTSPQSGNIVITVGPEQRGWTVIYGSNGACGTAYFTGPPSGGSQTLGYSAFGTTDYPWVSGMRILIFYGTC